jgi:CSLREA domain-containing protein
MQHRRLLPSLLPLLVFAACTEQEPSTAPAEPGAPAFSHTAGHKVVNSLADPGNGTCNATQCTLREAINVPGSTEISFAPGLTGAITLARPGGGGGPLVIEKTLAITGPSGGIVIQRRSTDPAFRILRIGTGDTVKLTNLTLRNGKTGQTGGGIINFGRLALTNCTVAGNSATLGGGGIDNHGRLVLTNSRVTNNSAPVGRGGGGINNHGNLTLVNSLVTGNSASAGGGISNQKAGRLALTKSTIAGNSASFGGGINNRGMFTLANSLVTGNSAPDFGRLVGGGGGGIYNRGESFADVVGQITNSTVARNSTNQDGGGIANVQGGRLTIIKSTIAGNSATQEGGGIFQREIARVGGGAVTLTNSTVSGNSASAGGGIWHFSEIGGQIILTNSTVTRNSATQEGGGIDQTTEGRLALTNSLVAQNSAPAGSDVNNSGFDAVARFSLIGNGSGSGITNTNGNQVGSASAPIDPKLGSLADNGGPTRTHALLLGSPAIDAASTPDCPPTDQRGVLRPQGMVCDIGSYERK